MDIHIVMTKGPEEDWQIDSVWTTLAAAKSAAEHIGNAWSTGWATEWGNIYYDTEGRRGITRHTNNNKRGEILVFYIFIGPIDTLGQFNHRMHRL